MTKIICYDRIIKFIVVNGGIRMEDLTTAERISACVEALEQAKRLEFEQTKLNDDLVGLYRDIIEETSKHGNRTIIFDYAKLLEEENSFYSIEEMYLYANRSTKLNVEELIKGYMLDVSSKMNECGLPTKQQCLFNEIRGLLGDAHGLLVDFTAAYRRINGVVAQNADYFIRHGHAF